MVKSLPPAGALQPAPYFEPGRALTLRDMLRPLFRYRRIVVATFLILIAATIAAAALARRSYESEMKILVHRERFDPGITGDAQGRTPQNASVSESELYAEVELLTSRDLLEKVAVAAGLDQRPRPSSMSNETLQAKLGRAVGKRLTVRPIKKTTVIRVGYSAGDPRQAKQVLDSLAALYLEKHLAMHRPAGAYQFFTDQAARFERELREAQAKLNAFDRREQIVSASRETETALTRLGEFEAALQQNQADIADATRRQTAIRDELAQTPDRQVTVIRGDGGVDLVRGLKTRLLELELKRTELLQKFTPQYPPAVELEAELSHVRQAIADAEQTPLTAQTTDQNPTHQWLRNEAARIQTEKAALAARGAAIRRSIAAYSEKAQRLDTQGVEQQQLLRAAKEAEENYTLYRRKQEEARISDALDRTRIANVAIAEPPSLPIAPTSYRAVILAAGSALSLLIAIAAAYLLNAIDPRFRTTDEVYAVLEVPVLAALPAGE